MIAIVKDGTIAYGPLAYDRTDVFRILIPYGATMTCDVVDPVDIPQAEPSAAMDLGVAMLLPVTVIADAPGDGQVVTGHETVVLADHVELRPIYGVGPTLVEQIASLVESRTSEAASACDAVLAPLAVRFSSWETRTWDKQLAEATAILAGDIEPTAEKYPTIGGIIAVTGETFHDFAMAVKANNEAWTGIVANVAGQRQAFVAALKAAATGATPADILAVPLSIELPV